MISKDAVELAYIEFQKDFEEGEETNQWLKNVIDGLKQAEKELKVLEIIKEHFNFDKDDIFEMDYKGKHYYMFFGRPIKKEKYDLLKKVLLDEENN